MLQTTLTFAASMFLRLMIAGSVTFAVLPIVEATGVKSGLGVTIVFMMVIATLSAVFRAIFNHCFKSSELDEQRAPEFSLEATLGLEWLSQSVRERFGRIELLEPIYRDEVNEVSAGRLTKSGQKVLVSRAIAPINLNFAKELKREVEIRKNLADVPSISKLVDCGRDTQGLPYLAVTAPEGINLAQLCGNLKAQTVLSVAKITAKQLAKIHRRKVVLQCLNAETVLLKNDGSIFFTALQNARRLNSKTQLPTNGGTETRGAAPELFNRTAVTSEAADYFAFGAMLFELLTGELFREEKDFETGEVNYRRIQRLLKQHSDNDAGKQLAKFIFDCVQKNPSRRPTSLHLAESVKQENCKLSVA